MPPHKREELRAVQSDVWEVIEATPKRAIRGGQPVTEDAFLNEITKSGRLTTVDRKTLRSQARRAAVPSTLDLEMDAEADAAYLVMARHESGAIVFVRPTQIERRSMARGVTASTVRFSIPLPQAATAEAPEEQQRRSLVGKVVKATVLKVVGKLADMAMPLLAKAAETAVWKLKGLHEGWKSVSLEKLQTPDLSPIDIARIVSTDAAQRNLLFIHGTVFPCVVGIFRVGYDARFRREDLLRGPAADLRQPHFRLRPLHGEPHSRRKCAHVELQVLR